METQHLLWTRYSLKLKLNENDQLKEEIDARTYWFHWRQNQFLNRTLVERKLTNKCNTALGIAYSQISIPNDPTVIAVDKIAEIRPQLEVIYNHKLAPQFSLNHPYWSELRFFKQTDGSFDFTTCRMRYKLELNYTPSPILTLKAFNELFLNAGGHTTNHFDQNRYGTSIQCMPLKTLGFELGYLNWYQNRGSGDAFYNRHMVRFTIHQTLQLKKQKSQSI